MEISADGDTLDPQDSLMKSSFKGSPIMRGSILSRIPNLWNSWDDGMMT